jgi:hypothetical protein
MSDMKHIEYCIKLGNTLVDKNIEENNDVISNNNFSNLNSNTEQIKSAQNEDFRTRLRNW